MELTAQDLDGLLRAYETAADWFCADDDELRKVLSAEIDEALFSNDLELKRRVLGRLKALLGEDVLAEDEDD
jgi:hypothetical protein